MIVRSRFTHPAAAAILTEHALDENTRNRTQPLLNEKADASLAPAFNVWRPLWNAQQQAEARLTQAVEARDLAQTAYVKAIRGIGRCLKDTVDNKQSIRVLYLPDGALDVLTLPLDELISRMEPYTEAILKAPREHLSDDCKGRYATTLDGARVALGASDAAHREVRDTRRARESADTPLRDAYKAYHRAVEYVCEHDRDAILGWIKAYPVGSPSGAADTDDDAEIVTPPAVNAEVAAPA